MEIRQNLRNSVEFTKFWKRIPVTRNSAGHTNHVGPGSYRPERAPESTQVVPLQPLTSDYAF